MDADRVSNIVKQLIQYDTDLSENIWTITLQLYTSRNEKTIDYLCNVTASTSIGNLFWTDDVDGITPNFIAELVEYLVNDNQNNLLWDECSVGSILIHSVLDSPSYVKLNGSYSTFIYNKVIKVMNLFVSKLSSTYLIHSKISEKCLSRIYSFFKHLLRTYQLQLVARQKDNTPTDKCNLVESLLIAVLDEMNRLLGNYSQTMTDEIYLKFNFLLRLVREVFIPNSNDCIVTNKIMSQLMLIIKRSDVTIRRDVITQVIASIITTTFSTAYDLRLLHEKSMIKSSTISHDFSLSQISLTRYLMQLVWQLGDSDDDSMNISDTTTGSSPLSLSVVEDIYSAVLIICLLLSLPSTIPTSPINPITSINTTATNITTANTGSNVTSTQGKKSKSKVKSSSSTTSSSTAINTSTANTTMKQTAQQESSMLQLILACGHSHVSESDPSESEKRAIRDAEQSKECSRKMWRIIQKGLLHPTDILLRKRCVFVIQIMHRCLNPDRGYGYDCIHTPSTTTAAVSDRTKYEYECWGILIGVFTNIEGSNSAHLVLQLIPSLERLFHSVATNTYMTTTTTAGGKDLPLFHHTPLQTWLPAISFNWIKSLLHCMLSLNTPVIRRLALYRLFSLRLSLQINPSFVQWLCDDLLCKLIDHPSYFSAYYLDDTHDLGCAAAVSECRSNADDHGVTTIDDLNDDSTTTTAAITGTGTLSSQGIVITLGGQNKHGECSTVHRSVRRQPLNPETYPGVLLPYFLTSVLTVCHINDNKNRNSCDNSSVDSTSTHTPMTMCSDLIGSVLRIVCRDDGIQSLSAMVSILSLFIYVANIMYMDFLFYLWRDYI